MTDDSESGAVFLSGQELEVQVSEGESTVPQGPILGPNPVKFLEELTIDNVAFYKKPDCKFYISCMDKAAEAGWFQFVCGECTAFKRRTRADLDREMAPLKNFSTKFLTVVEDEPQTEDDTDED